MSNTRQEATAENGTFADKCGDSFNLIFTAATTEGVTYVQIRNGNTITVTATANAGYVLTEPNWSQAQTDLLLACPVITPCPETSTSIVSKYEEFADYNETRATGHAEFTEDGLRVYTEGATSTDKVAWYNIVNPYSLQDVGAPAIDYIDSTATTNDEPGMQLLLDFDGNGSTDGILVGEKVYGDNWWLTNGSKAFVKAGAPHNGSGNGSQWYGTLNEWLAAYPNAQVTVVGFSLGSGVKGDGLLKSLTFGCQTWVFKKVVKKVTVCPAGNLPIVRSTDADKNGWTIPATAQYQAEGGIKLVVGGNWEESYISRSVDALIADIGTIVDFTATPSQYVGIHVVTSKGVLVYEKEASYGGKWWSTGDFGVNGGLGYATLDTLDNIVAANPDLKMSEIRVLYTSPDASNTVISSVKIGCVEYLFNKTGGSGGVVPTTPEIPATPVVPTSPAASAKAQTAPVGGQGSLPAELPMTGVNGSVLSTWIALLAAILTYGAVFYLQPKKRFEQ